MTARPCRRPVRRAPSRASRRSGSARGTTRSACRPGDICADVYFAEPVEVTRWAHLMGVRGIATLDPAQENKIIIRGAIETDD
ncbi:MAG: hypothetical protein IKG22_03975 [Atopobiaceae bacterium]|nr:hypothetical protein [Atopobiaceae bacterium]